MPQCLCPADFDGAHCETHLLRSAVPSESVAPAYIIVPVLLIIIAALGAVAVYVFFFRRNGRAGAKASSPFSGFGTSPSVSFRQGTNVEFGPTVFSPNGATTVVRFSMISIYSIELFYYLVIFIELF